MTATYILQPNPRWYLVNYLGQPLAPNGWIYTYSSKNKTELKFAYKDSGGVFPWTNPIPVSADGTVGPIYLEYDSDLPDEKYYIRVCKSQDPDDLVWDQDGLPNDGEGGGGSTTTALDLENLVANNAFYRNRGTSATPVPNFLKLAPGAHTGLAQTASNRGPDIVFIKNSSSTAIDTLSFPEFPLGTTPLSGDVTPDCMLNYTCTNDPIGETDKYVQFPITQNVKSLSGQEVSVTLWANLGSVSSATNLTLRLKQFFGDGTGKSEEVSVPIASITATSGWTRFGPYTITIPSVATKAVGDCHNDGLFLQVGLPLSQACNINFTKPALYLGKIAPGQDYHTYDMVESLVNDPRTGDIRISVNDYAPFGWVKMDDGTIGSTTSGASTRANKDTFPLYNQIWNSVSQVWAPVTGGRGSSAIIDFGLNKPLALTKAVGRVFAGMSSNTFTQTFTVNFEASTSILTVPSTTGILTGYPLRLSTVTTLPVGLFSDVTYYAIVLDATTLRLATTFDYAKAGTPYVTFSTNGTGVHTLFNAPYELGHYVGEDGHAQTIAELAKHNHPGSTDRAGVGPNNSGYAEANWTGGTHPVDIANQGESQPFNVIQPTTYMNIYIKL